MPTMAKDKFGQSQEQGAISCWYRTYSWVIICQLLVTLTSNSHHRVAWIWTKSYEMGCWPPKQVPHTLQHNDHPFSFWFTIAFIWSIATSTSFWISFTRYVFFSSSHSDYLYLPVNWVYFRSGLFTHLANLNLFN